MAISTQREKELSDIAEALKSMFPDDVTFSRHVDRGNNLIISWHLTDSPPDRTQLAREISIRIPESEFEYYSPLDIAGKDAAHEVMRRTVRLSMTNYTTGVGLAHGAAQESHIVEVSFQD